MLVVVALVIVTGLLCLWSAYRTSTGGAFAGFGLMGMASMLVSSVSCFAVSFVGMKGLGKNGASSADMAAFATLLMYGACFLFFMVDQAMKPVEDRNEANAANEANRQANSDQ